VTSRNRILARTRLGGSLGRPASRGRLRRSNGLEVDLTRRLSPVAPPKISRRPWFVKRRSHAASRLVSADRRRARGRDLACGHLPRLNVPALDHALELGREYESCIRRTRGSARAARIRRRGSGQRTGRQFDCVSELRNQSVMNPTPKRSRRSSLTSSRAPPPRELGLRGTPSLGRERTRLLALPPGSSTTIRTVTR
jgi:hypothetical protein